MSGRRPRREGDTSILGPGREFPSTNWSVLAARSGAPDEWRRRLEALAELYWKPIYRYLRLRWRLGNEEAKDLTQSFFVRVLEGGLLDRADRARGRFRAFVKTCLENHVRMAKREAGRLKRGGGEPVLRLDAMSDDGPFDVPADDATPAEILDAQWRAAVMERALARVREEYERENRPEYFRVLEHQIADEKPTYAQTAERVGVRATDVGNFLKHARSRLRDAVRAIVAESVSTPEALEREMKELFPGEGEES